MDLLLAMLIVPANAPNFDAKGDSRLEPTVTPMRSRQNTARSTSEHGVKHCHSLSVPVEHSRQVDVASSSNKLRLRI